MKRNSLIPSKEQYNAILAKLEDQTTLIALRMGAELGMTVGEISLARISSIDKNRKRQIWISDGAKIISSSKEKREREVPINADLYKVLKAYIDPNKIYILKRKIGDYKKPLGTRQIKALYQKNGIPWSTHKSRHFFKNCVWDWMLKNRQIDEGLMRCLMGHTLNTNQKYGTISWNYKMRVIDHVFCPNNDESNYDSKNYTDLINFCAKGMDIPSEKIEFLFDLFSKKTIDINNI